MTDMKKSFFVLAVLCATSAWAQIPDSDGFVTPNRPAVSPVSGEVVPSRVAVANLKEDTEATRREVKELTLRVEQLERENAALKENAQSTSAAKAAGDYATRDELKLLEMRLNDSTKEAIAAESKRVQSVILDELKVAAKKSQAEQAAQIAKAAQAYQAANNYSPAPAASANTSAATAAATTSAVSAMAATAPAHKKSAAAGLPVTAAEKEGYMKEGVRYTVQPGDTISSIAKKNHSSVRAIMAVNEIPNPGKLYVGRELFVPTL